MPKVYAMVLNTYNVSQIRHGVTSSVVCDETTDVEQSRFGHEFAPGRGEDHCLTRGKCQSAPSLGRGRARTGGGKLGIETFAHDALETHAGADEGDGDKGERVGPRGVTTVICDAGGTAAPECDRAAHREEGLDQCAKRHPHAGLHPIVSPIRPRKAPKMKESTE